eukprot:250502-Chlamydomonas_euryale.AAC.21
MLTLPQQARAIKDRSHLGLTDLSDRRSSTAPLPQTTALSHLGGHLEFEPLFLQHAKEGATHLTVHGWDDLLRLAEQQHAK